MKSFAAYMILWLGKSRPGEERLGNTFSQRNAGESLARPGARFMIQENAS